MGLVRRLGAAWQAWFQQVNATRPVLFVFAVLIAQLIVVLVLPQGRDLARATFDLGFGWQLLGFLCVMVGLALTAWAAARAPVVAAFGPRDRWWPGWLWRGAGRGAAALAMAPYVIAGLGTRRGAVLALAAVAVVAALIWRGEAEAAIRRVGGSASVRARAADAVAAQDAWLERRFPWLMAMVSAAGFALLLLLAIAPVGPARAMGSPALVAAGCAALIATVSLVYRLARYPAPAIAAARPAGAWRYLPVLAAGLAWAGLVMLTGLAANHRVGQVGARMPAALPVPPRPTLDMAFARWLATLPPADLDGAAAVPVVVVATAGGASRAAYWTGEVLSALDGPRFAAHLFAISSVSGGSLGTAAYLGERRCAPLPAADKAGVPYGSAIAPGMRRVNGADHLAPAVGAMLFPDLFQRMVPWPVFPDRARALEASFAKAWADRAEATGCDPARFDRPFLAQDAGPAQPGTRGWTPLWFSNGTRVEDGRRLLTSPVVVDDAIFAEALDWHQLTGRDVTVAQAITNSARFPLVSPTGAITNAAGEPRGGVIDGGYYENGGVVTAFDVARAVAVHGRAWAANAGWPAARFRVVLVLIDNDDGALVREPVEGVPLPATMETIMDIEGRPRGWSVLQGLYMTRTSRGEASRVEAARGLRVLQRDAVVKRFTLCKLRALGDDGRYRAPALPTEMNWFVSGLTRGRLDRAFEGGSDCTGTWRKARGEVRRALGDELSPPVSP